MRASPNRWWFGHFLTAVLAHGQTALIPTGLLYYNSAREGEAGGPLALEVCLPDLKTICEFGLGLNLKNVHSPTRLWARSTRGGHPLSENAHRPLFLVSNSILNPMVTLPGPGDHPGAGSTRGAHPLRQNAQGAPFLDSESILSPIVTPTWAGDPSFCGNRPGPPGLWPPWSTRPPAWPNRWATLSRIRF